MAVINLAYTGNVNPEGASPKLTEEQIWAALQRKVRRGQDFVPVIEATTVVKEERANEKNYPHVPAGEYSSRSVCDRLTRDHPAIHPEDGFGKSLIVLRHGGCGTRGQIHARQWTRRSTDEQWNRHRDLCPVSATKGRFPGRHRVIRRQRRISRSGWAGRLTHDIHIQLAAS